MYVVIELQKNGDSIANIVTSHDVRDDAESKYHQILSAAAISTVELHSAVMLNENGNPIKHEVYKHEAEEIE